MCDTIVHDVRVYNMIILSSPCKGDNHESGIKFVRCQKVNWSTVKCQDIGEVQQYK